MLPSTGAYSVPFAYSKYVKNMIIPCQKYFFSLISKYVFICFGLWLFVQPLDMYSVYLYNMSNNAHIQAHTCPVAFHCV